MPITREEATALAELLCVIRPTWNTRGVLTKGLGPLAKHPAPLEVIAWAALRAARNPEVLTPAVIPMNGPHWNLADRPETPRLTPEHECPRHVGKWAANCPSCAAEQIGRSSLHPDEDTTPDGWTPPTREEAIARAKRDAQAAKTAHQTAGDTSTGPGDTQNRVGGHVHDFRPAPDGILFGKTRYRSVCACGELQNPTTAPEPDTTP